jgi:2-oxo-4-hydroxy-4-carboxy-5-ureidoimidazoline decarboxylase
MRHSISELNRVSREEFVRWVGPVFEHSPWIATAAAEKRPFADLDSLNRQLCQVAREAPEAQQLALIQAHPDLGQRGALTAESTREQASAGLDQLAQNQRAAIQSQNQAYRAKFGFPFVICARLNNQDSILDALSRRLANSREQEIQTALEEIFKIAQLRLRDLCQPDSN